MLDIHTCVALCRCIALSAAVPYDCDVSGLPELDSTDPELPYQNSGDGVTACSLGALFEDGETNITITYQLEHRATYQGEWLPTQLNGTWSNATRVIDQFADNTFYRFAVIAQNEAGLVSNWSWSPGAFIEELPPLPGGLFVRPDCTQWDCSRTMLLLQSTTCSTESDAPAQPQSLIAQSWNGSLVADWSPFVDCDGNTSRWKDAHTHIRSLELQIEWLSGTGWVEHAPFVPVPDRLLLSFEPIFGDSRSKHASGGGRRGSCSAVCDARGEPFGDAEPAV